MNALEPPANKNHWSFVIGHLTFVIWETKYEAQIIGDERTRAASE